MSQTNSDSNGWHEHKRDVLRRLGKLEAMQTAHSFSTHERMDKTESQLDDMKLQLTRLQTAVYTGTAIVVTTVSLLAAMAAIF